MAKPPSAFAGLKLTDQTPLATTGPGLDQRLFSSQTPAEPVSPPSKEPRNLGTKEGRKQPSLEPRNQGTLEPSPSPTNPDKEAPLFDLNNRPYKNNTFAFTEEELEGIEDLKLELRRKLDLHATKNDLVRCAIHSLIEDYRENKQTSFIVRRIRKKTLR